MWVKLNHSKDYYNIGSISSFCYYDEILSESEVKEVSKTELLYNEVLDDLNPKVYYDSRHIENYELIDLSGNDVKNRIVNCEIGFDETPEINLVTIPCRRKGLFESLRHENNGFSDGEWKTEFTRWNQLRFYNEVRLNHTLTNDDGLSDLEFNEWGLKRDNKVVHINVGI
jgi:hypothetical protein